VEDQHFNTGEYDPRAYWDERAKTCDGSVHGAVCGHNVSPAENKAMERVQLHSLKRLLKGLLFPGIRVMEFGCGAGRLAQVFVKWGAQYTGVDISPEMLKLARANVQGPADFHQLSSTQLPFPDGSFDLVYSITVIHHNPYEMHESIVRELVRVTKPEGHVLIMEGVGQGQSTFATFLRPIEDWVRLFGKAGVDAVAVRPQAWWIFRDYIAYAPFVLMRKLMGLPPKRKRPFDAILAVPSAYLDPYLVSLLPRRFASNVAILFHKQGAQKECSATSQPGLSTGIGREPVEDQSSVTTPVDAKG
jgi:SAM-dependent methyltransferase